MRGCLTSLFILIALFLIGVSLLLPVAAGGLVGAAFGLAGFSGGDEQVTVTTSSPMELVALHADRIRLRATKASFHAVTMASVDLTLDDVALVDRTAGGVAGTLTGVRYVPADGPPVTVSSVALSGGGRAIKATLNLSATDVRLLAVGAVKGALGASPSKVTLSAPDRASVVVNGATIAGRLALDPDGGLVFRTVTLTPGLTGPIDLITPGPDMPFRLTSVSVAPTGVTLHGTVDPAMFGG